MEADDGCDLVIAYGVAEGCGRLQGPLLPLDIFSQQGGLGDSLRDELPEKSIFFLVELVESFRPAESAVSKTASCRLLDQLLGGRGLVTEPQLDELPGDFIDGKIEAWSDGLGQDGIPVGVSCQRETEIFKNREVAFRFFQGPLELLLLIAKIF